MKITITATLFLALLLGSCSTSKLIGNGSYSDLSLNVDSDKYEIKRLETLSVSSSSVFGIPKKKAKTNGMVVRFNGVSLNQSGRALPILTILASSVGIGYLLNQAAGKKPDKLIGYGVEYWNGSGWSQDPVYRAGDDKLPVGAGIALAVPVALMLNNFIYSRSAQSIALQNLNSQLLQKNPNVDVFLNPKYDIKTKLGLFNQTATVKANVMGATLKTN